MKLPVTKILLESVTLPWRNKKKYAKALLLPTLLLLMSLSLNQLIMEGIVEISTWVALPFFLISFSIFSVSCHRLALIVSDDNSIRISFEFRDIRFVLWILFAGFAQLIMVAVISDILAGGTSWLEIFESSNLNQYLNLISSIFATYVIARFCLVFPATAIDVETGLLWSWNTTYQNGWRTAIVIGLYPHLIAITIGLLVREGSTLLSRTSLIRGSLAPIIPGKLGIEHFRIVFCWLLVPRHFHGSYRIAANQHFTSDNDEELPKTATGKIQRYQLRSSD